MELGHKFDSRVVDNGFTATPYLVSAFSAWLTQAEDGSVARPVRPKM